MNLAKRTLLTASAIALVASGMGVSAGPAAAAEPRDSSYWSTICPNNLPCLADWDRPTGGKYYVMVGCGLHGIHYTGFDSAYTRGNPIDLTGGNGSYRYIPAWRSVQLDGAGHIVDEYTYC